jgi:hypothetical protein
MGQQDLRDWANAIGYDPDWDKLDLGIIPLLQKTAGNAEYRTVQ